MTERKTYTEEFKREAEPAPTVKRDSFREDQSDLL